MTSTAADRLSHRKRASHRGISLAMTHRGNKPSLDVEQQAMRSKIRSDLEALANTHSQVLKI
jgi:predicted component of type VI protein secretion system